MMKANKAIKKLILSSNLVDDDGIRAIADGLAVNSIISTLVCERSVDCVLSFQMNAAAMCVCVCKWRVDLRKS